MSLPSTSWYDPNWQDEEIMEELKLDAQQGTSDYLRDKARNRYLLGCATMQSMAFNTSSSPHGGSQIRLSIYPSGSSAVAYSNAITLQPNTVSGQVIESKFDLEASKLQAVNVYWGESADTDADMYCRWQWRWDSGAAWATIGTQYVYDCRIGDDVPNYISFWGRCVACANTLNYGHSTGGSGWIWILLRGFTVIIGRLDEEFPSL